MRLLWTSIIAPVVGTYCRGREGGEPCQAGILLLPI